MSILTAFPRPAHTRAHRPASIAIGAAMATAVAAMMATVPLAAAAAAQVVSFEATAAGSFWIPGDVGSSPLFVVQESGDGSESALGALHYELSVVQNMARPPSGCGPSSSTGASGAGVLTLPDGALSLHRSTGTSCFAFPLLEVEESWVVDGGSGHYRGASGRLLRRMTGDVRFGTATGSFSGSLNLPR
jgi:hypothetical protein